MYDKHKGNNREKQGLEPAPFSAKHKVCNEHVYRIEQFGEIYYTNATQIFGLA